ncbi:MAG TPA: maleylpyruvate isomerase N-terminal domain-containing protein [Mycobacteriales bacterium]|nr:maleylpyruvate isomerase N-terminal domain-containing protein [Mycobacteriales bacterium]
MFGDVCHDDRRNQTGGVRDVSVITPESTAELYVEAHDRVVGLVRGLSAEQAATRVAATPEWTVHDVVAHLAAIPTDIVAGRLKGIPRPEETQQQVDARRDAAIPALLEEWAAGVDPIVELARAGLIPPPLTIDVITHEQDLRGAIHAAHLDDDAALRFAVTGYSMGLARRIKAAGLRALRLRDPARGFDTTAGEGEPAATVSGREFDLFRALAGRRSRAQVEAFDWIGDPAPYLDVFCVFGPLAETDISD